MEESTKSSRRLKPISISSASTSVYVIYVLQLKLSSGGSPLVFFLHCVGLVSPGSGTVPWKKDGPKSHIKSDLSSSFLVSDGGRWAQGPGALQNNSRQDFLAVFFLSAKQTFIFSTSFIKWSWSIDFCFRQESTLDTQTPGKSRASRPADLFVSDCGRKPELPEESWHIYSQPWYQLCSIASISGPCLCVCACSLPYGQR